jgi:hypothetical protein
VASTSAAADRSRDFTAIFPYLKASQRFGHNGSLHIVEFGQLSPLRNHLGFAAQFPSQARERSL